ncbi:TonB-dependent receptor plug domain-containing protein [Halioxenophilus aromaticivorans]|uniref:TonB-dependent receptor n=1 Tax=Halioxenophilus aromaticivorans TaxID=1306992 RepID=A0AAV3U9Y4_9ALTE
MNKKTLSLAIGAFSVPFMLSASPVAFSQEGVIEEVVTLGSRAKERSVTDSPAPIDVISADDLASQGVTDMSDLFRNTVPSYNVNDQPISDAATLVRPANLRGLAPDHTLLLVNGKRRHRASVITWLGNGVSNGSQGPDLAAIPASAIKSVQVLRDGAAAQYGSDAIAGVIDFELKDDSEGGSIMVKYGQWAEEGEALYNIAINKGLPLGDSGFVNLTADWNESEATDRAVQRADAQGLIDAGYTGVPTPAMVWGTPEVEDDIKLFANFGYDLSTTTELYGYANHGSKTVEGGFYYRNPTNRGGVYWDGENNSLLVGALDGNTGSCPSIPLNADGTPNSTAFAQVAADPNCFTFQELIPGGFTPRFGGDITDQALLLGVRGEDGDFGWDVSAYYGSHESDFFINNTVNASLGPDTPRDFDPGSYEQQDINLSADFTYIVNEQVALAFGIEHREEEFTIGAGQRESYIDGGLGEQGFSTSSNGFPGFSPQIAGSWTRANDAIYLDAEFDVTDDLLITTAVRAEDFEDFGSTVNYKIGANYAITDNFGIRSTYSTGFKAPTPGQSNASNVSTQFVNGVLTNQGTIPATSAIAAAVGGRPLEPEESTNFAFGFYTNIGMLDLTVDYFHIEVTDRLNLSTEFALTPAQADQLRAEGVSGVDDIAEFRFFTNDFDTETSGIDIVASIESETDFGLTTYSLAFNHTKTEVTDFNPATVDAARVRQIEETTPDTRYNFSINHQVEDLRLLVRASYYDDFYDNEAGAVFDDAYTLDVEGRYDIGDSAITLGGTNILGEQGCECAPGQTTGLGLPYSQFSPFGFNGALWYLKYQYHF